MHQYGLRRGLVSSSSVLRCFGLILLSSLLFSCAEEVADINRVQPHYLKKSDLEGTWYARQTVVDHPSHISFAFTGIEGP